MPLKGRILSKPPEDDQSVLVLRFGPPFSPESCVFI